MSDILKFEDLYKYPFGKRNNENHNFDDGNPTAVCIEFLTPNHLVFDGSLDGSDDLGIGGDRMIVVADHPWALPEDDGVIGIQEILNDTQPPRLSMFVNDNPEDPDPPWVRDDSQPDAYQEPRDTWLKNGRLYYIHYYRTHLLESGEHNPMALKYQCDDKAEDQYPLDPPSSKKMIIEGVAGTWYPDAQ